MTKYFRSRLTAILALLILVLNVHSTYAGQWIAEGDNWRYEENGKYVQSEWRQSDGSWYFLDSAGYMARDRWVYDTYYVDGEGKMLTNTTTPDGKQVDSEGEIIRNSPGEKYYEKGITTVPGLRRGVFVKDGDLGRYYDSNGKPGLFITTTTMTIHMSKDKYLTDIESDTTYVTLYCFYKVNDETRINPYCGKAHGPFSLKSLNGNEALFGRDQEDFFMGTKGQCSITILNENQFVLSSAQAKVFGREEQDDMSMFLGTYTYAADSLDSFYNR